MLYATLKLLHVLSIVVWVGGMVFAAFFLRPAAMQLPPPQSIPLMHGALQRFFRAVVGAVLVVLVTGGWMIGRAAKESVQAGLAFNMPLDWTLMAALGVLMMAIFAHIRFALYRRLDKAVAARDWPAGGAALASIRTWVGVNLAIGVVIIAFTLLMA
ncbi:CopD family protein [Hydrogenophaga pseudoflava]|uniref:CopD family protein n=1 Tax=Hydrogenophaga pseudoflava TaxID=47421 RepID=UPI0027E51091|nr:CopD family protein [Hydrogenophaga pseudoflava]MDQ7745286.1 CopD family protein [Hydrogenophaga pseudoflava]